MLALKAIQTCLEAPGVMHAVRHASDCSPNKYYRDQACLNDEQHLIWKQSVFYTTALIASS